MKLKALVRGLPVKVVGSKDCEVFGLSLDSRKTAPKDLFIAQKGSTQDGAAFIEEAALAGASALVVPFYNPFLKIPQIVTEDPASVTSILAARFYGEPSKELWVAGVTGSKGKTTTCYLIHYLLEELRYAPGLLSTVEWVVGKRRLPSLLTTQDVISNQKLLREMVDAGSKAAVLEVSSHGLAQDRVEGIEFQVALFTNLFPDHLDYHQTLHAYATEKKKLFQLAPFAIYNADSPWTEFMKEKGDFLTFGIDHPADIFAEEIRFEKKETIFRVKGELFASSLTGKFNLLNLLGAIAVGVHLGIDLPQLSSIFRKTFLIPGRMERVSSQTGVELFVDYAHTGEALDQVLRSLKDLAPKKLIVVFGCGGGRDPMRRKEMGIAASKWADDVIVTTDNPRGEEPEEICRQILEHVSPEKAIFEIDRAKAIRLAIQMANPGDLILIAGKGHEKTQVFKHRTLPFDDVLIAKEELQKRTPSGILSSFA